MYGKIFDSMYDGTLYGHWKAIVTLQQMLVLCDPNGVIDMTPGALSGKTSIPLDIILEGIKVLSEPDPYSRTPGEEGRRIILIDPANRPWGWIIVNHAKYRDLQSRADKNEADRKRIAANRAAAKEAEAARKAADTGQNASTISGVAERSGAQPVVADVAHADADATTATEANANAQEPLTLTGDASLAGQLNGSTATWLAYEKAYIARYNVRPVRNAKVNSQIKALVARIGDEEAPAVAAFYLTHNNPMFVRNSHGTGLLLLEAESLRTQWARGRKVTGLEARSAERKDAVQEQVKRLTGDDDGKK